MQQGLTPQAAIPLPALVSALELKLKTKHQKLMHKNRVKADHEYLKLVRVNLVFCHGSNNPLHREKIARYESIERGYMHKLGLTR